MCYLMKHENKKNLEIRPEERFFGVLLQSHDFVR